MDQELSTASTRTHIHTHPCRVAPLLQPMPSPVTSHLLHQLLVAEVCVRPSWCAHLVRLEAARVAAAGQARPPGQPPLPLQQQQADQNGGAGGGGGGSTAADADADAAGLRLALGPEELAAAVCAGECGSCGGKGVFVEVEPAAALCW